MLPETALQLLDPRRELLDHAECRCELAVSVGDLRLQLGDAAVSGILVADLSTTISSPPRATSWRTRERLRACYQRHAGVNARFLSTFVDVPCGCARSYRRERALATVRRLRWRGCARYS